MCESTMGSQTAFREQEVTKFMLLFSILTVFCANFVS